jgi:hypothetical protein
MTTAPDLLRLAVRMQHHTTCTAPDTIQIRGARGDHGLLCRQCGKTWFPPPRLIETLPAAPDRPAPVVDERPPPRPRAALEIPGLPNSRPRGEWPTHRARERRRKR